MSPDRILREGYIGPVWCAGQEIIRRIFVTVRDRNWSDVPPSQWDCKTLAVNRHIVFARHTSELVDFEWQGELSVSEDHRELRFELNGRALRDMDVCRLGLVVLHPVEAMVGALVTTTGPAGSQDTRVTRKLHPQPIVNGLPGAMTEPFSKLKIAREDFGTLELIFDGELFELEDQRNWGDASFKTYCTPLRLGFPRRVPAGTTITHSVQARFTPAAHPPTEAFLAARRLRASSSSISIGAEWHDSLPLNLPWSHIQVTPSALPEVLKNAPDAKIELALTDTVPAEVIQQHAHRLSRLLLYGTSLPLQTEVPTFVATKGYFVEFNRATPFKSNAAGIAFPLTATVHATDSETILDNIPVIADMVDTARELTGLHDIAIAPLALRYPASAGPQAFPHNLVAPWLAATLAHASLSGVTSVTLGADIIRALSHQPELLAKLISR